MAKEHLWSVTRRSIWKLLIKYIKSCFFFSVLLHAHERSKICTEYTLIKLHNCMFCLKLKKREGVDSSHLFHYCEWPFSVIRFFLLLFWSKKVLKKVKWFFCTIMQLFIIVITPGSRSEALHHSYRVNYVVNSWNGGDFSYYAVIISYVVCAFLCNIAYKFMMCLIYLNWREKSDMLAVMFCSKNVFQLLYWTGVGPRILICLYLTAFGYIS